jgi:hypothetical protein
VQENSTADLAHFPGARCVVLAIWDSVFFAREWQDWLHGDLQGQSLERTSASVRTS